MKSTNKNRTPNMSYKEFDKRMALYSLLRKDYEWPYEGEQEEDPIDAIINKGMKVQED